ncbi:hypothetical protein ZWY2020_023828 [Hordeum vulgare]|nr:hypothetical protein ZWY2020_023828 [Hordeum vulgare]
MGCSLLARSQHQGRQNDAEAPAARRPASAPCSTASAQPPAAAAAQNSSEATMTKARAPPDPDPDRGQGQAAAAAEAAPLDGALPSSPRPSFAAPRRQAATVGPAAWTITNPSGGEGAPRPSPAEPSTPPSPGRRRQIAEPCSPPPPPPDANLAEQAARPWPVPDDPPHCCCTGFARQQRPTGGGREAAV